jgi:hypothetical protein
VVVRKKTYTLGIFTGDAQVTVARRTILAATIASPAMVVVQNRSICVHRWNLFQPMVALSPLPILCRGVEDEPRRAIKAELLRDKLAQHGVQLTAPDPAEIETARDRMLVEQEGPVKQWRMTPEIAAQALADVA